MPPRRRPRPRRSASRRRGRRSPRATGQRLPVRDPEEATMAETSLTEQLRALADQARDLAKMASDAASSAGQQVRSEEHTSELQSLMRISYAVFCLKKKIYNKEKKIQRRTQQV